MSAVTDRTSQFSWMRERTGLFGSSDVLLKPHMTLLAKTKVLNQDGDTYEINRGESCV